MPVYEYHCADCGTKFEALVRGKRAVSCPQCGSFSLDKLLSAPTVLSSRAAQPTGRGRTCCGRAERCDAPPCSTEGVCQRD